MAKMVQVFMVVRCYSCETFQVQQVRQGIGMRVFDTDCMCESKDHFVCKNVASFSGSPLAPTRGEPGNEASKMHNDQSHHFIF